MKIFTPYGEAEWPEPDFPRFVEKALFDYLHRQANDYAAKNWAWSLQKEVDEFAKDLGMTPAQPKPPRRQLVDRGGYYSLE